MTHQTTGRNKGRKKGRTRGGQRGGLLNKGIKSLINMIAFNTGVKRGASLR